uniref:Uncharacterized protein n=1 Tax=Ditylenchus dipsaci TaxID=166011 RepID=A0A915DLS9_9BILA
MYLISLELIKIMQKNVSSTGDYMHNRTRPSSIKFAALNSIVQTSFLLCVFHVAGLSKFEMVAGCSSVTQVEKKLLGILHAFNVSVDPKTVAFYDINDFSMVVKDTMLDQVSFPKPVYYMKYMPKKGIISCSIV